jgi:hypothetical protein
MTIVTESDSEQLSVTGYAVDQAGIRLAIRYTTPAATSLVTVRSLPELKSRGRMLVPLSTGPMTFEAEGTRLLLAHEGPTRDLELAAIDVGAQTVSKVAANLGGDLAGIAGVLDTKTIFVTGQFKKDLWTATAEGPRRLTTDGNSLQGALRADGTMVMQKRLRDGKVAIFLRTSDGRTDQITKGPLDVTPSFCPDGSGWLYAAVGSNEIVKCWLSDNHCESIQRDDLGPSFPTMDPSGNKIAYITLSGAPRARVVTLDGVKRDLGPAGETCAPIWAGDHGLWVVQNSSAQGISWAEIDVATGQRTGRTEGVAVDANAETCPIPPGLVDRMTGYGSPRIFALPEQTATVASRTRSPSTP